MTMNDEPLLISQLREEISELLADGLRKLREARIETERVAIASDDERVAMRNAHDGAMDAVQLAHHDDTSALNTALANRDVIGQAKGIIMLTMHCTADKAFQLLRAQSQAENRNLVEIATEVANRASRRLSAG